jgi:hypothetical protein
MEAISRTTQAIICTTQTIIQPLVDHAQPLTNLTTGAFGTAANLFNQTRDLMPGEPWKVLTSTAATGVAYQIFSGVGEASKALALTAVTMGVGYYLWKNKETPLPSTQALVEACQGKAYGRGGDLFVFREAQSFVEQLFKSTEFQSRVSPLESNPKLQQHLQKKVSKVLCSAVSPGSKVEIINRAIENLTELIHTAQNRVNADRASGHLYCLGICQDDEIESIIPLGDETHNGGKIPLEIVFKSGKVIVYKPRSMLPEKLLCDSQKGILRHEEFGTYGVICREDQSGNAYGYSELVQNKEEENTVVSSKDVERYVQKFAVLERLSETLGISDLHYHNVITRRQEPCMIDAEVYLTPEGTSSGLQDKQLGPLYVFDISRGFDEQLKGKNKLWFSSSIKDSEKFEFGMEKNDLLSIGVDCDKIFKEARLRPETVKELAATKEAFAVTSGRYVPVSTSNLLGLQEGLDHNNPKTFEYFITDVKKRFNHLGFMFNTERLHAIKQALAKDILNHDVPIFHYDRDEGVILYHSIVIGSKGPRIERKDVVVETTTGGATTATASQKVTATPALSGSE